LIEHENSSQKFHPHHGHRQDVTKGKYFMRKILVIADFNATGGTGSYLKGLIGYFKLHYSVHVVLHKDQLKNAMMPFFLTEMISYSSDLVLFPKLDSVLMKIFRRLNLEIFYFFIRDYIERARLERKYKPDLIIISQGGGYRCFAFLYSKKPLLLITHAIYGQSIATKLGGALYSNLFWKIKEGNKKICMVSEYAKDQFIKNMKSSKLAGCAARIWNYGRVPTRPRNVKHSGINVLTLGHLVEYKNPRLWLKVAEHITSKYSGEVRFVWAGSGELLQEMRLCAVGKENIEFVGYNEDTESLYGITDIYFQPSALENHSISVVEAMAHGIPCVVSDVGGMTESIENGMEGIVCKAGDLGGYIDAIIELIENRKKRVEMGANGSLKFEALFTKEKWTANMDSLLREILGENT
jgi:glycosyltransferase involved in cell wall biosynthesis